MFRKILVPLDSSMLAEQALSLAATVAARAAGGTGSIELLLVNTDASRSPEGEPGTASDRVYVNGVAEEASRLLDVTVTGQVRAGDPATAIVQRAAEIGADLIVMTTHGRTGLTRALLGSVADRVVREAGVPVLLQRPVAGRRWRAAVSRGFHRILVPLDGTQESTSIIGSVLDLCHWMEARPILARVVMPLIELTVSDAGVPAYGIVDERATREAVRAAQQSLNGFAGDIEVERNIRVETAVAVGSNIGRSLVEIANERSPDLIAMVTHSHGATRILVGSITDTLLRHAQVPLLLLHPRGEAAAHAPAHAETSAQGDGQ